MTRLTGRRTVEMGRHPVPEREETEMSVAMMIDNTDASQELYEALRGELQLDGPAGGAVHVAGPGPNGGWRVIEVWESVAEASRFLEERFLPALQAIGYTGRPPEPEFWPVHACLTATAPTRPDSDWDDHDSQR